MKDNDLAWLAGYLEGEGSFVYHKSTYNHRVSVQSTDRDVLERVITIVGHGKVGGPLTRGPLSQGSRTRKPIYWIQLHGPVARSLMRECLPHMGKRRQGQIEEALSSKTRVEMRAAA